MHELAITQGILEIAEREAAKHNSVCITRIKLRIGEFTGVVREALEFSFEVIKQGTIAENAELEIEVVKLCKRCPSCDEVFESKDQFDFFCPRCNAPAEIISGREMQIEYIDLD
jgi:hydrogenase nickel incorporation protein HypA/HybF